MSNGTIFLKIKNCPSLSNIIVVANFNNKKIAFSILFYFNALRLGNELLSGENVQFDVLI